MKVIQAFHGQKCNIDHLKAKCPREIGVNVVKSRALAFVNAKNPCQYEGYLLLSGNNIFSMIHPSQPIHPTQSPPFLLQNQNSLLTTFHDHPRPVQCQQKNEGSAPKWPKLPRQWKPSQKPKKGHGFSSVA